MELIRKSFIKLEQEMVYLNGSEIINGCDDHCGCDNETRCEDIICGCDYSADCGDTETCNCDD